MDAQFRWDARDYAANSAAQESWARELIGLLDLHRQEEVLDIGCGDGRITARIAREVPAGRAVGIDRSTQMVDHARAGFPAEAHPNLEFAVRDARELEFVDRFDAVFSNAALHWIDDHPAVLRGIARALERGGRLLLQMGGRGNAARVVEAFALLGELPDWRPYLAGVDLPYWFYGPEEYRQWLEQAGLVGDRVGLIPKTIRFATTAELIGWIRTTWMPYTERIPEAKRDVFIATFVDTYLQLIGHAAPGPIEVAMVRLQVAAHLPA